MTLLTKILRPFMSKIGQTLLDELHRHESELPWNLHKSVTDWANLDPYQIKGTLVLSPRIDRIVLKTELVRALRSRVDAHITTQISQGWKESEKAQIDVNATYKNYIAGANQIGAGHP